MTTHLLDTTFLIDYCAGDEGVYTYLEASEDETFLTTALNLKEVATGWRLHESFDRARLSSTFDWIEIVSFTPEHAIRASEYEAALYDSPEYTRRQIDDTAGDLLIAAVADVEKATVVTRNVDDFEPFDADVAPY